MAQRASDDKKEFAELLYMQGCLQNDIAEKVGVSKNTISKWVADGHWAEKRAAQTLTRKEVVNNVLRSINKLADNLAEQKDLTLVGGMSDQLSKLAATIDKLDKEASVVDFMECFMAFGRWLEYQAATDPEITAELRKAVNKYQNKYVMEMLGGKLR